MYGAGIAEGRFIPVYTGNTKSFTVFSIANSVYPCVYREHRYYVTWNFARIGLSLCIQGTQHQIPESFFQIRFIPVYTGNTTTAEQVRVRKAVYPCVYREHTKSCTCSCETYGLSLCIQGTLSSTKVPDTKTQFIPVYTGNTLIITYCLLIKIVRCKILPIFCCFFKRLILTRSMNIILYLS